MVNDKNLKGRHCIFTNSIGYEYNKYDEYDGQRCLLLSYNDGNEMWKVKFECGATFFALPAELKLIKEEINMKFQKKDLKIGDFCVTKDDLYQILPDVEGDYILVSEDGWNQLSLYNDDLTSNGHHQYDVIKVYRPKLECHFTRGRYNQGELIFDRAASKEITMTIGEIETALGIKNLKISKEGVN